MKRSAPLASVLLVVLGMGYATSSHAPKPAAVRSYGNITFKTPAPGQEPQLSRAQALAVAHSGPDATLGI